MANVDPKTVEGFGDEWATFDHGAIDPAEIAREFEQYFKIFPWDDLPPEPRGFDMGCGTGRWARFVAPRVGGLVCVDASEKAVGVARHNLAEFEHVEVRQGTFDVIPLDDDSMDFGFSLGVMHHIPDTQAGIVACAQKLKPGAPFLAYLYYAFDNKPWWFKLIWRASDLLRRAICVMPFRLRLFVSQVIAFLVYWPLARGAWALEQCGMRVDNLPLSAYRDLSFYAMRTDALDRFGTRLEQRFTRAQITEMFERAGLERIAFSDEIPFWCVIGYRAARTE